MRKAVLLALFMFGCGARTSLNLDELEPLVDGGTDSATTDSIVTFDSELPDTIIIEDAPLTETGCSSAAECDDGVPCTQDVCDPDARRCRNLPIHSRCDDGLFCTGDERCDVFMGCVTTPRNCADPISCTVDTCNETTKSCVRTPNDSLCPVSHGCDAMLGCQARAIAHTQFDLYEIRLPSGVATKIGPTTGTLTDVALHPSGTLYGVRFDGLCEIDLKTGSCTTPVRSLTGNPVGLDFSPDGTLYGAAGSTVYSINRTTGMTTNVVSFPTGMSASGDLAFVGSRMLGTATSSGGGGDVLVEFDLATRTAKALGRTGFRCIWGLAAYGPTLYGLTCEGRVLRVDPNTAASTELSRISAEFWGATAR
jgi:hypothetical protein